MDAHYVTCTRIGVYSHALTRGKIYEVFKIEDYKYRIAGDHGKRLWIHKGHFVDGIVEIPILRSWKFDDEIDELDFIDISMIFSDGSRRWSMVTTPEKTRNYFNNSCVESGFHIEHLIIMKTLEKLDVEETLRNLDKNDELFKASKELDES
ncbi:hypothetical protein Back11_54850 [Paenibacillus baekrokdamisoli]|uniref:Uncharacterized protein n=1 Tax=Paenibacillus baekrokdamisoli TaxID=1712516 RepID=A0A3G9IZ08_9BACL|nr:hypothetical protein [Paenibacillus baekrokdamisoli]MBB3071877.1 hypothetical protein [Paenibacillus baekrokdamisoli]BBH24140.1 hypothetical protein Back11_54850 [Paenibacillus baekrokdamisoli]